MNSETNPALIGISDLRLIATSDQLASVLKDLIAGRLEQIRLQAHIDKVRIDYEEIALARAAEMTDRDRDRAAVRAITELLILAGHVDAATQIFNNFVDRRPRFAQEVAELLLRSPPQADAGATA